MTPLSVSLLFSLSCVWWLLKWERIAYSRSCVLCPPQTTVANCISVNHDYIFCGCADGTVRIFNPLNLHFVTTLPKPHCLGTDIASVTEARYCEEGGRDQGRLVGVRTAPQIFAIWCALFIWTKTGSLLQVCLSCCRVALHGMGYSPKPVAEWNRISCSLSL